MNGLAEYWTAEYAAKAGASNPFVQSGRADATDPIAFLHTVSRVLRLLELSPRHTLLDVGCANGLLDVVLSGQCRWVVAIERVPALVERARRNLVDCPNVRLIQGDGVGAIASVAPCDRVLIWETLQLMAPEEAHGLFAALAEWPCEHLRVVLGAVPDARRRESFLGTYLAELARAEHLTEAARARIFERNRRAVWYDPDELSGMLRSWGFSTRVHATARAERFDLVATRGE
jgi:cyclopropane fatty-acyl-phospholipid synthase-like methyltransferase